MTFDELSLGGLGEIDISTCAPDCCVQAAWWLRRSTQWRARELLAGRPRRLLYHVFVSLCAAGR